ncbi:XRE family transcriptional regulator [Photorhabdus cinerea]|uniref:XRE family transcriptional regulator n=1 Tax=Photorhabdus cinerea TaxID=471575 RepID=UPI001F620843|nr:XRE family transcriptional regulator [Photorhabdus cinerea]
MNGKKIAEVSFVEPTKESIAGRLKQLIGDRSIRAAAKDWGLSFSTLNNYLTRGTEPSLNVALKISQVEQVSVEWIAAGTSEITSRKDSLSFMEQKKDEQLSTAWQYVFESLSAKDINELLRLIHRKGVEGLLTMTQTPQVKQDVEDAINSLPIRDTLKQAIRIALPGDEAMDKEILRRISNDERSVEPETGIVQAVNKNAG